MTDEQTAAAIVADARNACDETAMESAIVRALRAARKEGHDTWVNGDDVDLVAPKSEVVATLRAKAPPGHIIDDAGEVRRVLGTLPLTKDGCVVGVESQVWFSAYGGTEILSSIIHDSRKGWLQSPVCYSTREAAEAAKEGNK